MGGAVSSGRDNDELVDNLVGGNYIKSKEVEKVFRVLDRADYMSRDARDQAYKDLAWRDGPLHLSSPCIYSEVMEGLELKPGLSFLNVGSGTGYLSTLVGLILGSGGISHGVEVHRFVVEYANKKLGQFIENCVTLDEFDFCEPKFYCGNGLCLAPLQTPYDRVYCGAGCPEVYQNYMKQLIKVGGVLVMPLNETLVQVKRTSATEWTSKDLLSVSFAQLRTPNKEGGELLKLESQCPPRLQVLSRAVIRAAMRRGLARRHPELRAPVAPRAPPAKRPCPRRICIPVDPDYRDLDGLNYLHDLDPATGANEMNALLSLVLSMGHNRVAGALRFEAASEPSSDDDSGNGDDEVDVEYVEPTPDDDTSEEQRAPLPDDENGDERPDERNSERDANRADERSERGDDDDDDDDDPPDSDAAAVSEMNRAIRRVLGDGEPEVIAPPVSRDGVLTFQFREAAARDAFPEPRAGSSRRPAVPAEVEIYLGKASTSTMDWDDSTKRERDSSDDEPPNGNDEKRKKLDSGVGDSTPSNASTPDKTDKTSESEAELTSSNRTDTSDSDRERRSGRRRGGRRVWEQEGVDEVDAALRLRNKRRAAAGGGPRRVRLSVLMKRGVKELPLPHALKKYVNLGRCYQF